MLDKRWPRVVKGCAVDDRNLVGPLDDVLGAAFACLRFDAIAGLANNIPKFLGLANNEEDRARLAAILFQGRPLRVVLETALVGLNLTTQRCFRRRIQNDRCARAMDVAHRVARLRPPEALCRIAVAAAVLPTACYGSLWTLPAASSLQKLTTATIQALFGSKHGSRCPEIIASIFMDPVRMVPLASIVYKSMMDIRRILLRSTTRRREFFVNLELVRDCPLDNIHAPAKGLFSLAEAIGCHLKIEENHNDVEIICDDAQRSIRLLDNSTPLFKWNLRDFISRSILKNLVDRLGGLRERKDMHGITTVVDGHATLA